MSEGSDIEWTDHTFNPWWGCNGVSPGCLHCYAEAWARRFGVKFGVGEPRKLASEATWDAPNGWNAKAKKSGGPAPRVFTASMADVFDNQVPDFWRRRLWQTIEANTALTWLVLTKRIGNAPGMLPTNWLLFPRPHVWLGQSIVNQEEADREIHKLKRVGAAVHFLSCEPLIEPVDLSEHLATGIDWVIVGGESGPGARPMNPLWARSIRDQCMAHHVPFFFKQWGNWMPHGQDEEGTVMERMASKKTAGRLLDGRTHDDYPGSPGWTH